MAGTNNYKLLLEAQLDPKLVDAQIKALSNKSVFFIKAQFDPKDMKKFESELAGIKAKAGNTVGKISLFGDNAGKINKGIVEYTDKLGNAVKQTISLNKEVSITQTYTENLARDEQRIVSLKDKSAKLSARQADEMGRAALNAEKFLAKSQSMDLRNPKIAGAVSTAQDLKIAASAGDLGSVRKLNSLLEVQKASLSSVKTGWQSLTESMKSNFRTMVESAISFGVIYGALNQIKKGIEFVKDLNKEMTNIQLLQVEGASTDGEIAQLALQYNDLATAMGATTIEVAKGSVEWLRQGKTIEQTQELLQSSLMLSKLGNLDTAQSTEYLTAILNGFKIEAEDATRVVDKLISIDNIAATSAGELATAMQYSSAIANETGISFDNLAAYIGTVSSTTRLSAEMIGQAFKTMAVRMQSVKAGEIDETGMSLNNVEKTLSRIGIALRDDAESFRPLEDVIADVGEVWGTLDEVTKAQISNAIAGQRQAQIFSVLMQNFGDVTKYTEAQTNSLGLATDRYAIYLENAEAAQNRLRASWEKLAQSAVSSGMITGVYDALSGILGFIDKLGGVPAILTVIAVGLVVVYGNVATLSAALGVLETILIGISAVNPLGWVAIAAGVLVLFAASIETTSEKLERLSSEIQEHTNKINELRDSAKSISELSIEYERLTEEYKKTNVMSQEFLDIQNNLKELIPSLSGDFDEYGNFILDASNDMGSLNKETLEQIRLEKELRKAKIDESSSAMAKTLLDARKQKVLSDVRSDPDFKGRGKAFTEIEQIQINLDYSKALRDSKAAFSEMSIEAKKSFIQTLKDSGSGDVANIFSEMLRQEGIGGLSPDDRDEIANKSKVTGSFVATEAYAGFTETLQGLVDSSSTIDDLLAKSMQGTLGLADAAKIPPEYLDALTVQGDKLSINIDLLKQMQLEQAKTALESTRAAEATGLATEQQVQVVQFAYDQLLAQSQNTFGAFNQTAWAYDQLLWQISNDAYVSGASIVDAEGKALSSAQNIFSYMSQGSAQFNAVVQQIANITGQTVEQVMQQINGMIQTTANNAAALVNYLGATSMGQDSGFNRAPPAVPQFSGSLFQNVNGGTNVGNGYGSPSGGIGSSSSSGQTDEQKEAEKLRKIEEAIEKARQKALKTLNKQLDIYKDMIDARKELLDTMAEERTYQQDTEESQNLIANIQNEISELMLDNSEEAQARILALQEELADAQQDLDNLQYEHGVELQKDALDAEYAALESKVNEAIDAIESINATTVKSFSNQLAAILANLGTIPTHHKGVESGFVGGGQGKMKSNEVFAKLLSKELVVTPEQMDNFMKTTLPQIASGDSSNTNSNNFEKFLELNVAGNLDSTVLPQINEIIDKAIQKLNDSVKNRGYTRNANQYSL